MGNEPVERMGEPIGSVRSRLEAGWLRQTPLPDAVPVPSERAMATAGCFKN
jgi:hypothetical protein